MKGARLIYIKDAIKPGYSGPVTIKIKFRNPVNNWGKVGFKIKTYEVATATNAAGSKETTEYIMNVVESNVLIPVLKCLSPCEDCKQPPANDKMNYKMYKSYCTKCWAGNLSPLPFLHQVL